MNFLDISKLGHGRTDLVPDFCGDILYDAAPMWVNLFHYILAMLLYHNFLSQFIWHFDSIFRTLLILYFYIYQTGNEMLRVFTCSNRNTHNTTCTIGNRYIEFRYQLSKLQRHLIDFEQWCRPLEMLRLNDGLFSFSGSHRVSICPPTIQCSLHFCNVLSIIIVHRFVLELFNLKDHWMLHEGTAASSYIHPPPHPQPFHTSTSIGVIFVWNVSQRLLVQTCRVRVVSTLFTFTGCGPGLLGTHCPIHCLNLVEEVEEAIRLLSSGWSLPVTNDWIHTHFP